MPFDSYPTLPDLFPDLQTSIRKISNVVRGIMKGKMNVVGTVTLTANAASTTVTVPADVLGAYTTVLFMPTTANAATEFGAGSMYVSEINANNFVSVSGLAANSFKIIHANTASTDKTFQYVLLG